MFTKEQTNEIKKIVEENNNKLIERILLLIPETIGNMMMNHMALFKINKAFYDKYPEFGDHKDSVRSVVEMIEGKNPLDDYEDILKRAVPEIRERIHTLKNLDLKTVTESPKREFEHIEFSKAEKGHGKL